MGSNCDPRVEEVSPSHSSRPKVVMKARDLANDCGLEVYPLKALCLSALQLYKALQYRYRKGLDTLNENLPQMSVKLVFKQKRLQFEPGFEEIRQAHFKEIQKFLK
jgi:hypothetical protein